MERTEEEKRERYEKYGIIGTDPNLNQFAEMNLFPEKLAKANAMLKQTGFPNGLNLDEREVGSKEGK